MSARGKAKDRWRKSHNRDREASWESPKRPAWLRKKEPRKGVSGRWVAPHRRVS